AIVSAVTRSSTRKQQQLTTINKDDSSSVSEESDDPPSTTPFSCNKFDIKQLQEEQQKDPIIQKKFQKVKTDSHNRYYIIHDGFLFKLLPRHRRQEKRQLIYLPSSMIETLLQACHNDPIGGGHFSTQRTYMKLKEKYWWPDMRTTIENYIKACLPCQQFNISRKKKPGQLCPITPPEGPNQLLGIDFCGPLESSPSENRYVLTITDYFTRWVTAVALSNCSAQTTAEALFKHHICKFGVPTTILSDQGVHFQNQLLQALENKIGIHRIFSSVYHPQTNGMVERFNSTFIPQIVTLQDQESNNWDEFLDAVVFAYNTGVHATTRYSPFELLFGRKPQLPTDSPRQEVIFNKPNDYYKQLEKCLKVYHTSARQNTIHNQKLAKQRYDKNRPDPHYAIGDQVFVRVEGTRLKLDPRFSNIQDKYNSIPMIISKTNHPTYFVVDQQTNQEYRRHLNDLTPVRERQQF
ncbi:unnamed protein product, partial [Didymodactylos carnosus]